MKKNLLFVFAFLMLFSPIIVAQQQVMIGFTFSDNTDADFTADNGAGLPGNDSYNVRAENAAGDTRDLIYSAGATTYAATADNWDAGSDDKFWSIKFKADGYQNFKVSSKQYSDLTGPKEFKLQYKMGNGGTWTDITGGTVTVANDWASGVVNEISLPAELNDPGTTSIYIRWIMTSNTSVSNATVEATGASKIDDIMVYGSPLPTPVSIIGFNFTDNTDEEFNADLGLAGNLTYDIRAENTAGDTRTLTYTEGATDYAATASGWDAGSGDKFWSIKFKADGYHGMKVSSKQYSEATGPKDFKLQARFSGGDWVDIDNGTLTVASDWSTGVAEELDLPASFDNPGTTSIYIRWIMTSNDNVENGTVDADGISKIDDILVTGFNSTGFESVIFENLVSVFPNPCNSHVNIAANEEIAYCSLYDMQGKLISTTRVDADETTISTSNLAKGMYIVRVFFGNEKTPVTERIIVE
ncbi:MAG: T9SS type A sorting domain-containing protein [Bacteroidales bacterium]|nr:T9SS type A sorting domain-containing protein [Bacteroidales bacterium]HOY39069.1 T9SS type A sorting domain-containing protein [Bacteroidales bacterium]HQN93446.1 T9SS type A sorting domain-containing protein [Prolixibacteraceae bacterium]